MLNIAKYSRCYIEGIILEIDSYFAYKTKSNYKL